MPLPLQELCRQFLSDELSLAEARVASGEQYCTCMLSSHPCPACTVYWIFTMNEREGVKMKKQKLIAARLRGEIQ